LCHVKGCRHWSLDSTDYKTLNKKNSSLSDFQGRSGPTLLPGNNLTNSSDYSKQKVDVLIKKKNYLQI